MADFLPVLELMVIVFFALQLERINFSLKQISKSVQHLSDKVAMNGNVEMNGNTKPNRES